MNIAVIDPPVQFENYLYQEECCYNRVRVWQVPARSLHVASQIGADYVRPPASWKAFAEAAAEYDTVYLLYTPPLMRWLDAPMELRSKIVVVVNPPILREMVVTWGFREAIAVSEFGLDVAERFWPLFDGRPATIQAASGCPHGCHFCTWSYRAFSPRRWANPSVTAELANRSIRPYLICPQLTGVASWVAAFAAARRLPFNGFSTDLNCAHMPSFEADIRTLAEVGLDKAVVGTEAFCDQSLRRLGCPHTLEQSRRMMHLLAELAIEGTYQLRRGYGETLQEIDQTANNLIELLRSLPPNSPVRIRAGPVYYWHESELLVDLKTKWVAPLGYSVRVEDQDQERLNAWQRCYDNIRAAGFDCR